MGDIPRAVLSEHFQSLMKGRRLKTGVFLTFSFDPGFFEQHVLPVFLDVPLSHETPLALAQLEEALVKQVDHLAVYYDQRALEAGSLSSKLDVRRVPIAWPSGFFHPKVVLLLVESEKPDDAGQHEQALLVAALSANVTESGWWRNVEACHVEELGLGAKSKLRGDLLKLITRTKAASPPGEEHAALEAIRKFVMKLEERIHSTGAGVLHPRLYTGVADESDARVGVAEFLGQQRIERGLNLEVISPFFDEKGAQPLQDLIDVFQPREVRVFLPVGDDGAASVQPGVYDAVRKLENTSWGKLPAELLKVGTLQAATDRRVHAKVYRIFRQSPKYEVVFVGSANLTTAAHQKGGNFETGFLIQMEHEVGDVPDWWLSVDAKKPAEFKPEGEADQARQGPGMALRVRYSWDTERAEALWQAAAPSPRLSILQGAPLFVLEPLPPGEWRQLPRAAADELGRVLRSSSFLTVRIDGQDDATILVQEEGMARKPSLLLNLSLADILRCWSALTPEQKQALLENRYQEMVASLGGVGGALSPGAPMGRLEKATVFDTFAGYFHGFGSLQRRVSEALEKGREKEAVHLLFGEKYDSLPHLLDRLDDPEQKVDAVDRYVVLLCAQQVLEQLAKDWPDFAAGHKDDLQKLRQRLAKSDEVRQSFTFGEPAEREKFLDWFERWFLKQAEPMEAAEP